MPKDKNDLTPSEFPQDLNWNSENAINSLDKIYEFVIHECKQAIAWYYEKKRSKRILGYLFRILAILSITVSGVIPVLSEMEEDLGFDFSPAWATVALAAAALFIALDRLGGYTSGWIRYIRTGQVLNNIYEEFLVDWETERMARQNPDYGEDEIKKALEKCNGFLSKVNNVVSAETDAWAVDFQNVLVELEKRIKDNTSENN